MKIHDEIVQYAVYGSPKGSQFELERFSHVPHQLWDVSILELYGWSLEDFL
jgi:hypothetical protein